MVLTSRHIGATRAKMTASGLRNERNCRNFANFVD